MSKIPGVLLLTRIALYAGAFKKLPFQVAFYCTIFVADDDSLDYA